MVLYGVSASVIKVLFPFIALLGGGIDLRKPQQLGVAVGIAKGEALVLAVCLCWGICDLLPPLLDLSFATSSPFSSL